MKHVLALLGLGFLLLASLLPFGAAYAFHLANFPETLGFAATISTVMLTGLLFAAGLGAINSAYELEQRENAQQTNDSKGAK